MKLKNLLVISVVCMILSTNFIAQEAPVKKQTSSYFGFKNGLGFTSPDSSYSINFRFRIQNRALVNTNSDKNLEPASYEARVRRARLILTGHAVNPKLTYYLQLSFSRGDMDWSATDGSTVIASPNIVRDAMIYYKPLKNLVLGFGQGKLPGNRQRINSSSALQFYDRSIVNVNFTTDRDFGFFSTYTARISNNILIVPKVAITTGEGRNALTTNTGLAYTARIEVLPLGAFTDNGDFFEGDVLREKKPKISIAGGYQYNDLAVRTAGQLGKDLYGTKSYNVYFADFLFKYKGFALTAEYMRRDTDGSPVVYGTDGKIRTIVTGDGINTQLSYCFKYKWEIAARHSLVSPHHDVRGTVKENEQLGLGVSKYLNNHKVKIQANVFYNRERDLIKNLDLNKYFFAVFQVELGI